MTIVAGTLAERCQMAAYLCYSMVLAGFVYPAVRIYQVGSFGFRVDSVLESNDLIVFNPL